MQAQQLDTEYNEDLTTPQTTDSDNDRQDTTETLWIDCSTQSGAPVTLRDRDDIGRFLAVDVQGGWCDDLAPDVNVKNITRKLWMDFKQRGGCDAVASEAKPCEPVGVFVDRKTGQTIQGYILLECASPTHAWWFAQKLMSACGPVFVKTTYDKTTPAPKLRQVDMFLSCHRLAWKQVHTNITDSEEASSYSVGDDWTDFSQSLTFPWSTTPANFMASSAQVLGRDRMEEWMDNELLFDEVTVLQDTNNGVNEFTCTAKGESILSYWEYFSQLGHL